MKTGTLVIVLMFLSAPLFLIDVRPVAAANQDGDFIYLIDGTPLSSTVTLYTGSGGNVVIPDTLGGYPTTAIGPSAFRDSPVASVTMPDTVITIGQYAFAYCGSLNSVIIPDSVTHIAQYAFLSCSALSSLTLGEHLSIIGYNSFSNCTSLTSLFIPDNVTGIGDEAFGYCTGLTSLSIGSGVYSIGNAAFSSCTALTSVTMGSGVVLMGYYAFANCRALTSVTIPDSVVTFDNGAFSYCTTLASVVIGKSVTSMGDGAFGYCFALTSISFRGTVAPTLVGNYWLTNTNADLQGHALTSSDFPAPGGWFKGLEMGTVVQAAPGIPRQLVATPGNAQITVNWSAPTDNGGSPITGYKAYRALSSEGSYDLIGTVAELGLIDIDLTNGQTYWYKVTAVNSVGAGDRAGPASTTAGTPTAPGSLTASGSIGKVTLSWRTPSSDGGSAITAYRVYRLQANVPVLLATLTPTCGEYMDSNGSAGIAYGYCVQAVNSVGPGLWTAPVTAASQSNGSVDGPLLFGLLIVVIIVAIIIAILVLRKKRAARARAALKEAAASKKAKSASARKSGQGPETKQGRRKR